MKKTIMLSVISLLLINNIATADENNPIAWMYITCFNMNMSYMGDFVLEFHKDEIVEAYLVYRVQPGLYRGKGIWSSFISWNIT